MALQSVAATTPPHRRSCPYTHRLLSYAVASRLFVLTLIIIWRSIVSPYDTSASINPPCLTSSTDSSNRHGPSVLLPTVGSAIENSIVWDSVYFIRIAECGYEYEQTYAFLPLLPLCISFLSKTVFAPLEPLVGYRAVLGLSGYILNNIAFVFASLYLFRLSVLVLKDPEVAFRASVLFCFNPASIFYSSIYSESLYAFLSFGGLYHFMNGTDYFATVWLALSGCARSNGVLNAGYICFRRMQLVNKAFLSRKCTYWLTLKILLAGALCCLCIFAPFISFQAFGYVNICMGRSAAEMRPWCKARLPFLYNYIQSHYWGVGFLRYFRVKQLPNFLLASPILSLALCSIVHYVKLWPEVFLSLGLRASSLQKELVGSPLSKATEGQPSMDGLWRTILLTYCKIEKSVSRTVVMVFLSLNKPFDVYICFWLLDSGIILYHTSVLMPGDDRSIRLRKGAIKREKMVIQPSKNGAQERLQCDPVIILPFVLHLSFMVATAVFVMHVQVATRFLSASPLLYWFASHIMGSTVIGRRWGYLIWAYCGAYIFLGSLLFSNFYPFT
ncbi:GPI mannosyltransferase 2 [Sesamum angolense]|uniref:GPI mannosyltransferase 2 n=1 Tax=Sesamum angolense TaxID=2727404 RepID=A0AAE2BS74_9LAMI|nr:GPI mannosyltransferase 2 [Sesamum angolense]